MTRLIDELDLNDPEQAHAATLLQAGSPFPESEVSRQRVRRALDLQRSRTRRRRLNPVLAAAVFLGLAGSAGATWGIARWASPPDEMETKHASSVTQQFDATKGAARRSQKESPPDNASDAEELTTESSASAKVKPSSETEDPLSLGEKQGTASVAPKAFKLSKNGAKDAKRTASDALLLHQAVEALRSSDDPQKAAQLLREYERTQPSKELEEEVLALRIETALANKDPKARELARRYLARYPNGRFRSLATTAASQEQ